MAFNDELLFEEDLIEGLCENGWEKEIIRNPNEEVLIKNWAKILFDNNRERDRLNHQPLTDSEMQQILEQINNLRTPLKLNGFINGKTVSIKRDNLNDPVHVGKEISLKIYDRMEIAAGKSRYQIVSQPKFKTPGINNDRRGDLMLLINGMPVIHIELKKTGIPVIQGANQIEKYSREGVFKGLYSLVQIFVTMNPEETLYFANPGEDNKFNSNYYFHWADFNNEPINNWKRIASSLLSIPMAHQLIGFYTVADNTDGLLKVLRSYQYYAAHAISDKVAKTDWSAKNNLGGYIWHTTGSGKTMTSFKSAQLIASSKDSDKVIFLVDRIELGTQSLREYRSFASDSEEVQATEDTKSLVAKLKSTNPKDTLIVTSIQKMSNISDDSDGLKSNDIELMKSKRIVIVVDEAHRSTFGDMLYTIKTTFSRAIFFGFTGTPIHDENKRNESTTADVFGNELHRYTIADGIRDKNVLGFDPCKVLTFKDKDLRKVIALEKAKAKTEEEALSDETKSKKYYEYMNIIPMAGYYDDRRRYIKGIEDHIPMSQYDTDDHRKIVADDIIENWLTLSHDKKFHAILATSSINEAIEYYHYFKHTESGLRVAGLFDPSIDNEGKSAFKEEGLVEILEDYNALYNQSFTMGKWGKYKKDVASRLAHKAPYINIDRHTEKQLDLLIVVNQMLTGFDSKWINTLYVDKLLQYEHIIQAFSRTNRLFGPDKPFGTVKYYRKSHTMEKNIEIAIKSYSGNRPTGLFVPKIKENVEKMNTRFIEIKNLFTNHEINDFKKLPDEVSAKAKFSKLFKQLNDYLEASKIQGFKWPDIDPVTKLLNGDIEVKCTEIEFSALRRRYKELSSNGTSTSSDVPYEIATYITEIATGAIDTNYMNSNFVKYLRALDSGSEDDIKRTLDELHSSFATLSQEEQKYAEIFLHDIERGEIKIEENKTLRDYITDYQKKHEDKQISKLVNIFGLDESQLRKFMSIEVTEKSINEYGRFDDLKKTIDFSKARKYFESLEDSRLAPQKIHIMIETYLRNFIIKGGSI
jgi:type I restriction enzyme R subunit